MKIGIVASSQGSAFEATRQILSSKANGHDFNFHVVTDRSCGIEMLCQKYQVNHQRFSTSDNRQFSIETKKYFDDLGGVDVVLLFFLRLVTKELFSDYPTFNLHPALLPSFRGFQAVKKAREARVRFLGCTLHLVDEHADQGPVVAQASCPVDPDRLTLKQYEKISFLQKVYLSLLLLDLRANDVLKIGKSNSSVSLRKKWPATSQFSPCLQNPEYQRAFSDLVKKEKMEAWIQ